MRQLCLASLLLFTACSDGSPLPTVTCHKNGQVVLHGNYRLETPWYGDPRTVWISNPGGHIMRIEVDECTLMYVSEKPPTEANP